MIELELLHNDIYKSQHLHTVVLNMMFNNRRILISLGDSQSLLESKENQLTQWTLHKILKA